MKSENPLLLMCHRIHEPIFMPKGDGGQFKFNIPTNFWLEKYQSIISDVLHFVGDIIKPFFGLSTQEFTIQNLTKVLHLDVVLKIGHNENFSIFNKQHQKSSTALCKIFMEAKDIQELLSACAFCRDRVNPQMFIYCLYICMLHRDDCKHIPLPNLWETFPDKFMDCSAFNSCKETANIVPEGKRTAIKIAQDWTASDVEPEHRLAYWREDIGVNLHHWHWHLIYPPYGLDQFVNKPKRGELNYYMHHQIMARYNTERFCNGLPRTRSFEFRQVIPEGYFPKLTEANSGRNLPGRPANMMVSDINRPNDATVIAISDMERLRNRILEAINSMSVKMADGNTLELDERDGIDILVNLMEASSLSINPEYYGDFHNLGHMILACIHDPDYRFLEGPSVMGDTATAMRDPVFYRWHALIDDIFTLFKDKLPPYSTTKLSFPGVTVENISIETKGENTNTLSCHWVESTIDVSRGLDFAQRGSVLVSMQHLDHKAFKYHLTVRNANHSPVRATVRIFMAPKYNERGNPLSQNDQRMLMIEMDKSIVTLSKGENNITIDSFNSSVTIPWEATFKKAELEVPLVLEKDDARYNADQLCGCGWPLHMLVPKGNERGFPMDLFVMFSNYDEDKAFNYSRRDNQCNQGVSFCGLKNQAWPEIRSMGYPFDRVARHGVETMQDFLTPNMKIQPITIRFAGKRNNANRVVHNTSNQLSRRMKNVAYSTHYAG